MDTTKEKYTPQIRDILVWPDDGLHVECHDIVDFNEDLEHLVADMFVTMVANEGVGMAAPQIGELSNVLVIRLENSNPLALINPEVVEVSEEEFEWEEGCLSVPGYFEKRKRPNFIVVKFKDTTGEEHTVEFRDLYAFAILHEIDHLKGKVFVDGSSWFKENRIKKKIRKAQKKQRHNLESIKAQLNKS